MLVIGIVPDKNKTESYSEKWELFLNKRGVAIQKIDLNAIDFSQIKKCHGVMWRWLHTPADKLKSKCLLQTIEQTLKIPVFPDYPTSWFFDDKLAQSYFLKADNIPAPETWVFWDSKSALVWLENAKFPLVFKLSSGAGSSNVTLLKSFEEAKRITEKMFYVGFFPYTINEFKDKTGNLAVNFLSRAKQGLRYALTNEYPPLPHFWWMPEKNYALFQEFLPNNEYDTRVTIIGKRAFAFRRYNRTNDFRASGSGKIDYDPNKINLECVRLAFSISEKHGFQSMAYDFLEKSTKPMLVELSYTFVDKNIYECPGFWDKDLKWIEGHLWPEEAQVEDFLERIKNEHRIS